MTRRRSRKNRDNKGMVFVDVNSPKSRERRRKTIQWAKDYVRAVRELLASFDAAPNRSCDAAPNRS